VVDTERTGGRRRAMGRRRTLAGCAKRLSAFSHVERISGRSGFGPNRDVRGNGTLRRLGSWRQLGKVCPRRHATSTTAAFPVPQSILGQITTSHQRLVCSLSMREQLSTQPLSALIEVIEASASKFRASASIQISDPLVFQSNPCVFRRCRSRASVRRPLAPGPVRRSPSGEDETGTNAHRQGSPRCPRRGSPPAPSARNPWRKTRL
jgi:hypothetical protein